MCQKLRMIPVNMDKVVVFPAPLCPSKAVICPSYMFKFMLFNAGFILPEYT